MDTHTSRPPRIGIVGAGQLARMMIEAMSPLGLTARVLATAPDDAAALAGPDVVLGPVTSLPALLRLAEGSDVVTFDHEQVDGALVRAVEAAGHTVYPSSAVLSITQDKLRQREVSVAIGLPVPPFAHLRRVEEIERFGETHGWPVVLKARRGGYDGRGVWFVHDRADAERVWQRAAASGLALIAERFVPFDVELAVLAVRRPSGEMIGYPVVESVQRDGVCREVFAPAVVSHEIAQEADRLARRAAEELGVVGVLALELFLSGGELLVNEFAARPHNSGHYTIEGCVTSQFENHVRAVLDLPLGDTILVAPSAVMVNVLGESTTGNLSSSLPRALAIPGAHVHLYGKEARPGRKLGHVTALGETRESARDRAMAAAAILAGTAEGVGT